MSRIKTEYNQSIKLDKNRKYFEESGIKDHNEMFSTLPINIADSETTMRSDSPR